MYLLNCNRRRHEHWCGCDLLIEHERPTYGRESFEYLEHRCFLTTIPKEMKIKCTSILDCAQYMGVGRGVESSKNDIPQMLIHRFPSHGHIIERRQHCELFIQRRVTSQLLWDSKASLLEPVNEFSDCWIEATRP